MNDHKYVLCVAFLCVTECREKLLSFCKLERKHKAKKKEMSVRHVEARALFCGGSCCA